MACGFAGSADPAGRVEDRAGVGLQERLVGVLGGQRRLLVLDNCEHLRAGCADLLAHSVRG